MDKTGVFFRLLALVPHGNVRATLNAYRAALFQEGWLGAFSFPVAAPLAILRRPLTHDELVRAAVELRRWTNDRTGCIPNAGPSIITLAGFVSFLGLQLELPALKLPNDAVCSLPQAALCLAALPAEWKPPMEVPPPPSFPLSLSQNYQRPESLRICPRFAAAKRSNTGCMTRLCGNETWTKTRREWALKVLGEAPLRTCALANILLHPLDNELSFAWETGRLVWLPHWKQ